MNNHRLPRGALVLTCLTMMALGCSVDVQSRHCQVTDECREGLVCVDTRCVLPEQQKEPEAPDEKPEPEPTPEEPELVPFPLSDTLRGASLDTSVWVQYKAATAALSFGPNGMEVHVPAGSGSRGAGIYSKAYYSLEGSAVHAELRNAGAPSTSFRAYFELQADAGSALKWILSNGVLVMTQRNGGVDDDVEVPYNPSLHRFLRFRETAGTIFWEASSDAQVWTVLDSRPSTFPVSRLLLVLGAETLADASDQNATWLNVNAVSGKVFFVSPQGSDTNAGTSPAAPWKTLTPVNVRNFEPGETVLFEGGSTFSGNLYFDSSDLGTQAEPVTLASYGSGRAILAPGAEQTGLYAENVAGLRLSQLHFTGAPGSTASGLNFYNTLPATVLPRVELWAVEISGFGQYGFVLGSGAAGAGYKEVNLRYVSTHHNVRDGIMTYGFGSEISHENVYVGHCRSYENTGDASATNSTGSGILLGGVNGAVIERSLAHHNGASNTATSGPVGIWTYNSNNVVIQYNESYSNKSAGGDGGGFDIDGGVTNSVMQYNYSHENDGPGFMLAQYVNAPEFGNNTIRFNISQNDGRKGNNAGIALWSGDSANRVRNSYVYNNTVFMSPNGVGNAAAMASFTTAAGIYVSNNIFVTAGGARVVAGSGSVSEVLLLGNNYWSGTGPVQIVWGGTTYTSISGWRAATLQETAGSMDTSRNLDPLLTQSGTGTTLSSPDVLEQLTAYRLASSSPMRGAGFDLQALFSTDPGTRNFFGVPLGSPANIGAD